MFVLIVIISTILYIACGAASARIYMARAVEHNKKYIGRVVQLGRTYEQILLDFKKKEVDAFEYYMRKHNITARWMLVAWPILGTIGLGMIIYDHIENFFKVPEVKAIAAHEQREELIKHWKQELAGAKTEDDKKFIRNNLAALEA